MDADRFEALTRFIGSRTSRRAAVGLAATGLLGIAVPDAEAARCSRQNPCPPCKRCRRGRCKPDPTKNETPCAVGKTCRDGRCACNPGTGEIAGRCITACTDACRAAVNCCNTTYDTSIQFCGRDYRPCETALPCTSHRGCASTELCGSTCCPAVGGSANKCVVLCQPPAGARRPLSFGKDATRGR